MIFMRAGSPCQAKKLRKLLKTKDLVPSTARWPGAYEVWPNRKSIQSIVYTLLLLIIFLWNTGRAVKPIGNLDESIQHCAGSILYSPYISLCPNSWKTRFIWTLFYLIQSGWLKRIVYYTGRRQRWIKKPVVLVTATNSWNMEVHHCASPHVSTGFYPILFLLAWSLGRDVLCFSSFSGTHEFVCCWQGFSHIIRILMSSLHITLLLGASGYLSTISSDVSTEDRCLVQDHLWRVLLRSKQRFRFKKSKLCII